MSKKASVPVTTNETISRLSKLSNEFEIIKVYPRMIKSETPRPKKPGFSFKILEGNCFTGSLRRLCLAS